MNLIQTIEAEQIAKLTANKKAPEFRPGDTLKVGVRVVEGERTRVQNYEGVCIARCNRKLVVPSAKRFNAILILPIST